MPKIVPLPRPALVPEQTPYERFCSARQVMIKAYSDWLKTSPPLGDVVTELDGTHSIMQQLLRIKAEYDV